jgi:hypothetical protein
VLALPAVVAWSAATLCPSQLHRQSSLLATTLPEVVIFKFGQI